MDNSQSQQTQHTGLAGYHFPSLMPTMGIPTTKIDGHAQGQAQAQAQTQETGGVSSPGSPLLSIQQYHPTLPALHLPSVPTHPSTQHSLPSWESYMHQSGQTLEVSQRERDGREHWAGYWQHHQQQQSQSQWRQWEHSQYQQPQQSHQHQPPHQHQHQPQPHDSAIRPEHYDHRPLQHDQRHAFQQQQQQRQHQEAYLHQSQQRQQWPHPPQSSAPHPQPQSSPPHSSSSVLPPGLPYLPDRLKFHLVSWLEPNVANSIHHMLAQSSGSEVDDPNDAHLIIINPSLPNRHLIPPLNALPSVRASTTRLVPYDWFFRTHYSRISSNIERSILFVDERQEPIRVAFARDLQADSSTTRLHLTMLIQNNGGVVVDPKLCQVYIVDQPESDKAGQKAKIEGCPIDAMRKSLDWIISRWEASRVVPIDPSMERTASPAVPSGRYSALAHQQKLPPVESRKTSSQGRAASNTTKRRPAPYSLKSRAEDRAKGRKASTRRLTPHSKMKEPSSSTSKSTTASISGTADTTPRVSPYTPYTPDTEAFLQQLPPVDESAKRGDDFGRDERSIGVVEGRGWA